MQDAAAAPVLSENALEVTLALAMAATLAAAAALAIGRVARFLENYRKRHHTQATSQVNQPK